MSEKENGPELLRWMSEQSRRPTSEVGTQPYREAAAKRISSVPVEAAALRETKEAAEKKRTWAENALQLATKSASGSPEDTFACVWLTGVYRRLERAYRVACTDEEMFRRANGLGDPWGQPYREKE